MTMNAATVSGDNSTIALSDNGDGSTATGVGVQLERKLPNGGFYVLMSAGQTVPILLKAQ